MTSSFPFLLLLVLSSPSSAYFLDGEEFSEHLTTKDLELACRLDDDEVSAGNADPPGGGPAGPDFAVADDLSGGRRLTIPAMWRRGVPYTIQGFDAQDRAAVAKAMAHLQSVCGIRFIRGPSAGLSSLLVFRSAPERVADGSCRATFFFAGLDNVTGTVSLPPRTQCTVPRTVIHEILHSLGHFHTHQRRDRDQHVVIRHENYPETKEKEFQICTVPEGKNPAFYCQVFNQPYECDSVMHYARNQFSIGGDTIVARDPSSCRLHSWPHEWNSLRPYLSFGDRARLVRAYGPPTPSGGRRRRRREGEDACGDMMEL